MIEYAGLLYGIAKDIGAYLKWTEEDKLVNFRWPQESGFASAAQAKGYQIRWTEPGRIDSRKRDGYEVLYEVDDIKRVRRRLALRDGSVLMIRKFKEAA